MLITPAFAQSGGFAEGGLGLMPIILVTVSYTHLTLPTTVFV